MAKLLKLRRGTTSQHSSFTGAEGEVTVDTDKEVLVVHDGSTAGGHAMAAQDMDNVPAGSILGTQLENSGVTAGQYGSSSAIPIVTVDAQGLVTAASTTAIDSTTIANGSSSVSVANNGAITSNANHDFSAGIDVTGDITTTGDIDINSAHPRIDFNDTGANPDWSIINNDGVLGLYDQTNAAYRFQVNTDGHVDVVGNLDVGSGVDVTGDITLSGKLDISGSSGAAIEVPDNRRITLGNNGEFYLVHSANYSQIKETGSDNLYIDASHIHMRDANAQNKLQTGSSGITVTGSIAVTGTVDGRDVAADGTKLDGITTGNVTEISGSASLANGVTAATQAQSDNSTKVSTTAYVRTAISEAQAFPSGTNMLFKQTSAPTGWTKMTTHNNKALRVVSGTASSGGSNAFTNTLSSRGITANSGNATQGGNVSVSIANGTGGGNVSIANTTAGGNVSISSVSTSGNVNSHTLSSNEMPSHSHGTNACGGYSDNRGNAGGGYTTGRLGSRSCSNTNSAGGNGGHSHGFSGSSHNHNGSLSGTAHNHNATFTGTAHSHNANASFSGSAHNHSISVSNLDMAVQYIDVIIATKD